MIRAENDSGIAELHLLPVPTTATNTLFFSCDYFTNHTQFAQWDAFNVKLQQ